MVWLVFVREFGKERKMGEIVNVSEWCDSCYVPTTLELTVATLTEALYNKVIALLRVPQSGMHTSYF